MCWSGQSLWQPQYQEEDSYSSLLSGRSGKEFIAVMSLPVSSLYVLLAIVTINLIRLCFYYRMFSKTSAVKYLGT